MKDKVYVSVRGLQLATQEVQDEYDEIDREELIEVINVGKYKVVNGNEYIKYDEVFEGYDDKCTSIIKISDKGVDISKRGAVNAQMSFIEGEKTMTFYDTPYGNIYLGIFSRKVDVVREEDKITINIDYALELNYQQVSDAKVEIVVSSGKLDLEKK